LNLTGAVVDNATGLPIIDAANYTKMQSLNFTIGTTTFEITPNGLTWPRSNNTAIGGKADAIYLVVKDIGSKSGEGLDFIIGYRVLRRFYCVYDFGAEMIGVAKTKFTYLNDN
jgi:pepsin A